eukprot:1639402-Pyramimonas_sp.AAC.1
MIEWGGRAAIWGPHLHHVEALLVDEVGRALVQEHVQAHYLRTVRRSVSSVQSSTVHRLNRGDALGPQP